MPAGSRTADITAIRERSRQKTDEVPEVTRWPGADDPAARRLPEDIPAGEEEHADDIAGLLGT